MRTRVEYAPSSNNGFRLATEISWALAASGEAALPDANLLPNCKP